MCVGPHLNMAGWKKISQGQTKIASKKGEVFGQKVGKVLPSECASWCVKS